MRWQATLSRPADPPRGNPPILVVGDRTGSGAAVRRAARAYRSTPVWVDRLDPADPRPLRLVLDGWPGRRRRWRSSARAAPPVAV